MNLLAEPVTRLKVNDLAGRERVLHVVLVNFDCTLRWVPPTELNDLLGSDGVLVPVVDCAFDIQEVLRPVAFTCLPLVFD